MFVKIMLKKEEEWYKSESLEVPKIPFLDNDPILGKQFMLLYSWWHLTHFLSHGKALKLWIFLVKNKNSGYAQVFFELNICNLLISMKIRENYLAWLGLLWWI